MFIGAGNGNDLRFFSKNSAAQALIAFGNRRSLARLSLVVEPADAFSLPTTTLNKQKKHHEGAFCLLEQATGIEPASQAWEARVLPLNYACIACWNLIYRVQFILQA